MTRDTTNRLNEHFQGSEEKLEALRRAVAEGQASGYPDEQFDFAAFRKRVQEEHGAGI